jgi:lipopolysaccharide export system permease protein
MFVVSLFSMVALFLVVDFFERIDNILPQDVGILTTIEYFALKIPQIVSLMMPVAMLLSITFSIGILSKNSEIIAMRASGLTIFSITRSIYMIAVPLSLLLLLLNEGVVPGTQRRVKEVYNIDIKRKNLAGTYSQENFWWRDGKTFYSANLFDSRDNSLHGLVKLDLNDRFEIIRRVDAENVHFLTPLLGWNMSKLTEYNFKTGGIQVRNNLYREPLSINKQPKDFYDVEAETSTMSYRQLKRFIATQAANGLSTGQYHVSLYDKLISPFLIIVLVPVVLPFALRTARSGSFASGFIASITIAFSYYVAHSLSLALGRAELLPSFLAASMASLLLIAVGAVLSLGSESPS